MSDNAADLVLHLALDDIREGKFRDASGVGHDAIVKGDVTFIPDDVFGACASFPGNAESFLEVPHSGDLRIAGDITVEAWVFLTTKATDWVRIIGKGNLEARNFGLWYHPDTRCLFQRGSNLLQNKLENCQVRTKDGLQLNTWYHLAGVLDGPRAAVYIHDAQGRLLATAKADWQGPSPTSTIPLTIGSGPNSTGYHNGKIANLRVYKRALSQAEIEHDITADRMALVAFRKSHPIDFHLYDEDDQPVLYISDDPTGHNLRLEMRNTSTQDIQWRDGQSGAASADNHHFAVRFRPGTLSKNTLSMLRDPQKRATILKPTDPKQPWDVFFPPAPPAANEAALLYLLYTGPEKSIKPNETRALTLQHMSAAPGSGARGSQVELLPNPLTVVGGDATPITGSRTQYVHITNHRGKKNIPLHVWFEGGNTVLNDGLSTNPDGSSRKLILCIGNASGAGDLALTAASKFVISFDVGGPADAGWVLTDKNGEAKVVVTSGDAKVEVGDAAVGVSREWSLTFPEEKVLLRRGSADQEKPPKITRGPLKITLDGIRTIPKALGHANLYVRYENIPGYQDGQFILTIEKSPFVYDNKGHLAMGKPIHALAPPGIDVAGTVIADRLSVSRDNDNRGGLFLAVAGDFNHAIYNNASNLDGEGTWDGAKWNAHQGLNIRIGNRNAKPSSTQRSALLIDDTGHVGIGTPRPKSTLAVAGGLAVGMTYAATNAAPANSLIVQGALGLGAPQPNAKLDIAVETTDATPVVMVRKGTTNYLTIGNTGEVRIGSPLKDQDKDAARTNFIVNGRMQSSSSAGGLWLSDKLDGFVGNNGSYVGFWVPTIGFNVFQIEKTTGKVSISKTLEVGDTRQPPQPPSPPGVLTVHGTMGCADFYATGTTSLWNPLNMYIPEDKKWYRLGIFHGASDFKYANWGEIPSDIRLKEEVRPIPGALEKVNRLQGILHRWSDAGLNYLTQHRVDAVSAGPGSTEEELQVLRQAERQKAVAQLSGTQLGLVAQDVEAIVPEVVHENEDGHKCIRYPQLVALLIEAVKEQDKTVQDQAEVLAQYGEALARLTAATSAIQQQLAALTRKPTP